MDLSSRAFWSKYCPLLSGGEGPYVEKSWQEYSVDGVICRSMLMPYELSLLYALAKDYWHGEGAIVDTGCLYGLTTRMFADGILKNPHVPLSEKSGVIFLRSVPGGRL